MRAIVLGCLAVSCARAQPPVEAPPRPVEVAVSGPIAPSPPARCVEVPVGSPERERGIDAFLAMRADEALETFDAVIRANPRDRAAEAFYAAARKKIEQTRARTTDDTRDLKVIALEPFPLAATTKTKLVVPAAGVHLEKVSEAKNLITDVGEWHRKNGLKPRAALHTNEAPSQIPVKLQGQRLRSWLEHADHSVAIYERLVLVAAPGRRPRLFDFAAAGAGAPVPLTVEWAAAVGDHLVATFAYNGYAKDSGGRNGYVAAFRLETGALAWSSSPLVANAGDALVAGRHLVTGYGFTAEPDFVYVIDLENGAIAQKVSVKSSPEAIRVKADRLYVRTYDTDYVFRSTSGMPPAPPAALARGADEDAGAFPEEGRCHVRRATAAILARDADALHASAAALKPLTSDRVLAELLSVEEERLRMKDRLDLTSAPLVVAPAPPWDKKSGAPAKKTNKRLVRRASAPASPVRGMDRPRVFDATKPLYLAPVDEGRLPAGARTDIPATYGRELLSAVLPQKDGTTLLVYGGRYVVTIDGHTALRALDLEAFRHPPKADAQWKMFAAEDATHAELREGTLYVCNGGGSYAREVFGKKGFLSALDAKTGELVWRSAPLVCNASFAIDDDVIVSGYGFTDEPDFLVLLRREDGATEQKLPLPTAPQQISIDGRRVRVEAYAHTVDFDLVP